MENTQKIRYIPGLDGLRAFAIFFIAAYHFNYGWARGGFLGVNVFFVLSGYLITSKILQLQEDGSGCSLRKVWGGRIKRLMPAYYAMIITAVVWVIVINKDLLATVWGDLVSSASYTTNWWFIFHKLSYFDSFGSPSPVKHLWYMAVQEQFFAVWSIVLVKGYRYVKKRAKFSSVILIVALCSSLLMGILYNPDGDPSRIYYGTDTRGFELLIGGLLALVLPLEKLSSREVSVKQRWVLNIAGIIAFALFIICAVYTDEFQAFIYRGGLFLFDLNAALLMVCICRRGSFIGSILSWKPLRWIGTRSYGIYLWHYPIMTLSTPIYEVGNPVLWRVGLQMAVTCVLAELSYRFIEKPIRQLGFRGFCRKYLSFSAYKWGRLALTKRVSAMLAAVVLIVSVVGIARLESYDKEAEEDESYPAGTVVSNSGQGSSNSGSGTGTPGKNGAVPAIDIKSPGEAGFIENNDVIPDNRIMPKPAEDNNESPDNNSEAAPPVPNNPYRKILAIGDSIMLDIAPNLNARYNNITIDGKVSRQLVDAVKLAPTYANFNSAGNAVILELGTNGYFSDKQIDSLLNYFSKAHVYLINTRVPRKWEKTVNELLYKKAAERENVDLIDWYSLAVRHPEFFGRDGVHLRKSGSEALTKLIDDALVEADPV